LVLRWCFVKMAFNQRRKTMRNSTGSMIHNDELKDNLDLTLGKIISTMCSCGALSIAELEQNAKITLVSSTSIIEGGAHDVILKEANI